MTLCGWQRKPTEEEPHQLDKTNSADYAVLVASTKESFFNQFLLDDRPESYKLKNRLATQVHSDWCTKNCTANRVECAFNPDTNKYNLILEYGF